MIAPVVTTANCETILRGGVDTPNPPSRRIDWVPDCYVVMIFHTPFEIKTSKGWEHGQAGQMLIDAPGRRETHRGISGEGFRNDWLHLNSKAVQMTMEQSGLSFNEIFTVSNPPALSHIIAEIMSEHCQEKPNHRELLGCKVTELILMTSRYLQLARRQATSPVEYAHYERFCALRQNLNDAFTDRWTVEAMAKMVHLSPNRFAVLYRKFFNVSPMGDLIGMRLEEAEWLLTQGKMTVSEIAEQCGFNNLNYFSRLFKARTGRTPRESRQ